MSFWLLLIPLIVVFVIVSRYFTQLNEKKKLAEIRENWAKPVDANRNFNLIAAYLNATNATVNISAATQTDLDVEAIFSFIDRTSSKVGQQYLYKKLLCMDASKSSAAATEQTIEDLQKHRSKFDQIQLKLSGLNYAEAYYLPELFSKQHQSLFPAMLELYIRVSAFLVLALIVSIVVIPNQLSLLLLIVVLILNAAIHFKNKNYVLSYTHSLSQLLVLNNISQWLAKEQILDTNNATEQALGNLFKLKRSLSFINVQSAAANDPTDITYLFTEWIKMLLLIEPLIFISSIKKVNKYLDDIRLIYEAVAEIDVSISILSVRDGLPYYCKPEFDRDSSALVIEDVYHPLIDNCVANSITSNNAQGVLITGSNMSGKTTFIRSVAINTLLAQTINTCCARVYRAPPLRLFTSIDISDDLGEQKSYFQAEALAVLNIIDSCAVDQPVKSLVIIDEIFRGTNTIERIAAAKAVLAYLVNNKNFVFVSTHDLEIAALLGNNYAVYSFEELIGENRLVFDYKIKTGLLKNKNGIAVLQGLGYPQAIVDDAYEVSKQLRDKYEL